MRFLYLAVWPNLTFSFILAEDEDDAFFQLDQLGPPGAAKVERYDGPFFIDFMWAFDGEHRAEYPAARGIPCGDEAVEMYEAVLELGFPHFHSYYRAVWDHEKKPDLGEAKAALSLDLDTFPESGFDVSLAEMRRKIDQWFGPAQGAGEGGPPGGDLR